MAKVDAKWLQFDDSTIELDPNDNKKFRVKINSEGALVLTPDGIDLNPEYQPDNTSGGVPVGGTAGQILSKIDGTDFNVEWINQADLVVNVDGVLPNGGTAGQILTKIDGTDYNVQWVDQVSIISGGSVPVGGTTGQILSKIDGTDYNTQWVDVAAGGGITSDVLIRFTSEGDPTVIEDPQKDFYIEIPDPV